MSLLQQIQKSHCLSLCWSLVGPLQTNDFIRDLKSISCQLTIIVVTVVIEEILVTEVTVVTKVIAHTGSIEYR